MACCSSCLDNELSLCALARAKQLPARRSSVEKVKPKTQAEKRAWGTLRVIWFLNGWWSLIGAGGAEWRV